jgi:D-alanine--poly(phosphoribitol) ligase subunit 1
MKYDFERKQFSGLDIDSEKLAIAGSDADLNWDSLKHEVEKLAAMLKELHIPQGHPVVIYGHKESAFPVAMLACIHCTIPYIPLDIIYPIERVKKIVDISGSQILINCTEMAMDMDIGLAVEINSNKVRIHHTPDFTNSVYGHSEDPLQYIMFTSGSTGEPKGVQITKQAVQAFLAWILSDYGFGAEDVFMNQAPFTFDISLYDLLAAFALGGSVVLNSSEVCKSQDDFLMRISAYKCTVWNSTPSFIYLYLRNPSFHGDNLKDLHTILLIGEEFPHRTADILLANFKKAHIFNAYGPTEATVATSWIELTDELLSSHKNIPIGYAMPGCELLIEKISAESEHGELIIVGDHVSVGYLKKEELNAEKFFLHKGKRAFRTGDLVHEINGLFFFDGRNDDQVKWNGYRIELNEISAVICRNPLIADAVTVALKRNGEVKKLISFVILRSASDQETFKPLLLGQLQAILPVYMMPGEIVPIIEFPYSSSHKVDKSKLIDMYMLAQR